MFDVGFWELSIIAVVALIVIGPERLPKVARTAGHWLGRGRRFMASVKADIDKEIKADELKQILEQQAQKANPLHEIIEETEQELDVIKRGTEQVVGTAKNEFDGRETPNADKS
ncbi:MAG: Sec-independent protein translocase protein TatB [Pseudomonadota bacterium]